MCQRRETDTDGDPMHQAWIISSGTELTLGQSLDTNAAWLAARLAQLGIRAQRHVTVPDDVGAIRDVLVQAASACDVILVTGGLGPTVDDVTRQAVADAAGVPLELHAPSLERLRSFFADRQREMPAGNVVQAMIPRTASAITNTCGTAPGLYIELRGTACYVMPGVPFEMKAMFQQDVEPRLRASADGSVLLSRRLHTFGVPESELGERIADLMQRGRNPEIGTTAELGMIGIRINAAAATRDEAQAYLDAAEAELRRRLGHAVFGRDDDTLAGVIGALLVDGNHTLSTAESCTGGLIGAFLTDIAGSSRYYLGGAVTYANEAKTSLLGVSRDELERHGAVSDVVARAMAEGAARAFGTHYAVSVTGIAGPDGGTAQKPVGLVFIGLHTPSDTRGFEFRFGSDSPRHVIRARAARTALNLLRLELLHACPAG